MINISEDILNEGKFGITPSLIKNHIKEYISLDAKKIEEEGKKSLSLIINMFSGTKIEEDLIKNINKIFNSSFVSLNDIKTKILNKPAKENYDKISEGLWSSFGDVIGQITKFLFTYVAGFYLICITIITAKYLGLLPGITMATFTLVYLLTTSCCYLALRLDDTMWSKFSAWKNS